MVENDRLLAFLDPGGRVSRDPARGFELEVEKDPENKQAQVDLGSNESMDASDPLSVCQPGDSQPAPSNAFPPVLGIFARAHEATSGRVVQTPTKKKPYKVILEHEGGASTEQPVSTIREGEALIREETPLPPKRNTLRDQPAEESSGQHPGRHTTQIKAG